MAPLYIMLMTSANKAGAKPFLPIKKSKLIAQISYCGSEY